MRCSNINLKLEIIPILWRHSITLTVHFHFNLLAHTPKKPTWYSLIIYAPFYTFFFTFQRDTGFNYFHMHRIWLYREKAALVVLCYVFLPTLAFSVHSDFIDGFHFHANILVYPSFLFWPYLKSKGPCTVQKCASIIIM